MLTGASYAPLWGFTVAYVFAQLQAELRDTPGPEKRFRFRVIKRGVPRLGDSTRTFPGRPFWHFGISGAGVYPSRLPNWCGAESFDRLSAPVQKRSDPVGLVPEPVEGSPHETLLPGTTSEIRSDTPHERMPPPACRPTTPKSCGGRDTPRVRENPRHSRDGGFICCAPEGTRTPNLLIRSQMLYPLSYGRPARSAGRGIAYMRLDAKAKRAPQAVSADSVSASFSFFLRFALARCSDDNACRSTSRSACIRASRMRE